MDTRMVLLIIILVNFIVIYPIAKKRRDIRLFINLHMIGVGLFVFDISALTFPVHFSLILTGIYVVIMRILVGVYLIKAISKTTITNIAPLLLIGFDTIVLIITGFSILYKGIFDFDHNSFNTEKLTGLDFLYYSVVTFTTTGYGDIVPVTVQAKMLASLEMFIAFFTSTVYMAVLVSKLIELRNR